MVDWGQLSRTSAQAVIIAPKLRRRPPQNSAYTCAMSPAADNLAASIAQADSKLTVLDDRLDVEDHIDFMWLSHHILRGYGNHRIVVGTEVLADGWNSAKTRFLDVAGAQASLTNFLHSHTAMHSLRTLAESLSFSCINPSSDAYTISVIAAALVDGRAWWIEVPKKEPASRFVSKTSPAVFDRINPLYGTKVDFTFIASQEGNQWLRGYVPMSKGIVLGRSGMTVATGFDLGQWSTQELTNFGFPQALLDKITPFASPNRFKGMTKMQVAASVAEIGPVPILTQDEADLCDGAVFSAILGDAVRGWNAQRGKNVPLFTALPAGWQTVWLSRNYQEGPSPANAEAIAFRTQATSGNWQQAIAKLRGYTSYTSRATQEANLLAKELPAAIAPPAGAPK